jgi:hypothetical protein
VAEEECGQKTESSEAEIDLAKRKVSERLKVYNQLSYLPNSSSEPPKGGPPSPQEKVQRLRRLTS